MSQRDENKFQWFINQEEKNNCTFKSGVTYKKIKEHKLQMGLFDDDFKDCDSGYCGL
jgi:hypothetical protein